jgi:hypothetical protein
MRKITMLVNRGWKVEIMSDSQGWFNVGFWHNSWGDASGYAETLSEAINIACKNAKELERY